MTKVYCLSGLRPNWAIKKGISGVGVGLGVWVGVTVGVSVGVGEGVGVFVDGGLVGVFSAEAAQV